MYKLGDEIDVKKWRRERALDEIMNRLFLLLVSIFTVSGVWMVVDFGLLPALCFLGSGIVGAIALELI